MKIQLKYPRCIGGKDYAPGVHKIPDELAEDWYLKALLSSGVAVVVVEEVKEEVIKKPEPKKGPSKKEKEVPKNLSDSEKGK